MISATSGLVGCQVLRHVYSDDGRVLLIERGSHLDGEYRIASLRPGAVRIPVLWTRIRTPNGVTVDIESPGTGQLGESGVDGYVDGQRVDWDQFDTLAVPGGSWCSHENTSATEPLYLFVASDEPVLKALSLYKKWGRTPDGDVARLA